MRPTGLVGFLISCIAILDCRSKTLASTARKVTIIGLFADNSDPLYTLPFTGPAVDAALEDARLLFPKLSVTFVILRRNDIITCIDQVANMDLVAKFYLETWDRFGVLVIVQPGKLCFSIPTDKALF